MRADGAKAEAPKRWRSDCDWPDRSIWNGFLQSSEKGALNIILIPSEERIIGTSDITKYFKNAVGEIPKVIETVGSKFKDCPI